MWQAPYYCFPGSSRTYYPSYDAYFGFAEDNKSPPSDSRQNQHIRDTAADHPLALPAPNSCSSPPAQTSQPTGPMAPTSQGQPQPLTLYLLPPQQDQNQPGSQGNSNNQGNAMKPPSHFIPAPLPPGMFPVPPHPLAAQPPNMFPPPMPFPPQHAPSMIPPAGPLPDAVLVPGQPQGSRAQAPTLPAAVPTQVDTRYKCEICGRYRSARYHYRHPIPPGQVPGRTICRKCREEATDSEETASSDSYQEYRSRHHRSRGPSQRRRHQSRSGARFRDYDRLIDDSHTRYIAPTYSVSDSPSPERESYGSRRQRYRRPETPATELVRRTRRVRLSPLGERTYYDGENGRYGRNRSEDRRPGDETAKRTRSRSKAPATEARILRRQYSDPFVKTPQNEDPAASCQGYVDGPAQTHQRERERYPPQRGPSPPWIRQASMPVNRGPTWRSRNSYDSDDEHAGDSRRYVRLRSRSAERGRRDRRHTSHIREDNQEERDHIVMHAPSPPLVRPSSLGYMGEADFGEPEHHETRLGRSRRRHSRPRSCDDEEPEPDMLRPGDELTVIERHEPRPGIDYDWYDDEGMRVRVREISR